jgi:hypothetical protein
VCVRNILLARKTRRKKYSNNKEEHEKVIILGRICTRLQTRISCYYITAEPIVKNDKEIKKIDLIRDFIEDIEKEPVYNFSDPENSNNKDRDFCYERTRDPGTLGSIAT